jgi:hypothetical protein
MSRFIVAFVVFMFALPAFAQRGAPYEGSRGGPIMVDMSDGEPISFFLEISRELGLTDPQKTRLMDMRRRLRVQNAPFMLKLDSLRALAGLELGERGGLSSEDRQALERFRTWSRPVIDSIRINNDVARAEVRAMLDASQLSAADSIARDARTRRPARRERPPGAR